MTCFPAIRDDRWKERHADIDRCLGRHLRARRPAQRTTAQAGQALGAAPEQPKPDTRGEGHDPAPHAFRLRRRATPGLPGEGPHGTVRPGAGDRTTRIRQERRYRRTRRLRNHPRPHRVRPAREARRSPLRLRRRPARHAPTHLRHAPSGLATCRTSCWSMASPTCSTPALGQLDKLVDLVDKRKPAAAVILDTIAAAFPGLQENESADMGKVIKAARRITQLRRQPSSPPITCPRAMRPPRAGTAS